VRGSLERALAFTWALAEATSDEVARFDGGTVLRSPSLPDAWSANCVRFERADPGLTLAGAERIGDAFAIAPYLQLHVEEEATALRLLGEARAAAWKTEREVVMVLESIPDAPAAAVREGTRDEQRALMRAWLAEEGQTDDAIASLMRRIDREHAAWPEAIMVADHDGVAAAMATVRYAPERDVANVEDVYAAPVARGAGLGRAVTAAAARHAAERDTDVVFICADDTDWPKELYGTLGFAPLARRAQLHRAAV
jgi:GNAT superfamily N-acetyltransferase